MLHKWLMWKDVKFLLRVLMGEKFSTSASLSSPRSGEMARCHISTSCQTITADTSRANRKNGWVTACPAQRRGSIQRRHHRCAETQFDSNDISRCDFQHLFSPRQTSWSKWDRKKIYSSYERNIWLIRHQHLFPFISELLFGIVSCW